MDKTSNRGVILFAMVYPTLFTWAYFDLLADSHAWAQWLCFAVGKTIQFGLPVFWWCIVDKRKLTIARPNSKGMALGIVFGLLVLCAILALYYFGLKSSPTMDLAAQNIKDKIAGFQVDSVPKYVVLAAFYAIGHAFLEEYYWRWFVFGSLDQRMKTGAAVALSSAGFMAHHVLLLGIYFGWASPATYAFSIAVAIGGAIWAWLYHTSGRLYGPWASHAVVDLAIFVVGYDVVRDMLG